MTPRSSSSIETTLAPGDVLIFANQLPHGAHSPPPSASSWAAGAGAGEELQWAIDLSINGPAAALPLPPGTRLLCAQRSAMAGHDDL